MKNTVKINLENLKGMSYNNKCSLASDDYKTSSYELDMLVDLLDEKEDNYFLKNAIAINKNTSAETLDKLSKDEDSIIRYRVAINKNTSAETLDKLSKDENSIVRDYVVRHKNISVVQVKEVEVVLKDPFDNIKKLIVNENKISFINQYDTSFSLSNLQYPIQNDISGKTISELLKSLLIGNKIDVEKKFNDFLLKTVYRPISITINK